MKKIIALVLAALMMFTLVAPASAATVEIPEKVVEILPVEVTEKVNAFALFTSAIKDFVHKIVGTITQFFGSKCPFCDNGTHLVGTPSASVKVLEEKPVVNVGGVDYTLDVAYNFEPSELTEKTEDFRYWHADYVITTTKDVKNILFAGQYDEWSENYVGFVIPEIKAGEEVRLLKDYSPAFNGGKEIYVNCEEVYNNIVSFNCGLYNNDASNNGATITVELRLYETKPAAETEHNTTNEETGRFVTVATVPCTIKTIGA